MISGTKSAPREIMLDNSILESGMKSRNYNDPEFIRVSTPPRVITLSEHHFPSASDDRDEEEEEARGYFEPKHIDFSEETKKNNRNRKLNLTMQDMATSQR